MEQPGWATDDLAEEWVEPSTSPTHEPTDEARALFGSMRGGAKGGGTVGTIGDKRGTLRSLGYAAPRGLPSFRSPSAAEANTRIVSGHNSRPLVPSGEFLVPTGTGLLSPPSSRSSSEGQADIVGTCVVNDAAADDRGGYLARGIKGKDIFGKNPLERMFEPPSPPVVGYTDESPPTPSPVSGTAPPVSQRIEPRRVSHPYAPSRPSRLSKSMTPSSNGSTMMSEISQHENDVSRNDIHDQSQATTVLEQEEGDGEEDGQFGDITDLSQLHNGATRFPFTFKQPRVNSGETGTGSGTGSGSATIRGGTVNSDTFNPDEHARDDGPNHSTVMEAHLPARPIPTALAANDKLRLFRSTYDTYTQAHLSAIVDSFAVEPSPSPPRGEPSIDGYSTPRSNSDDGNSEESRSEKRVRLSPPSPDFEPRDWGKQGMDILSRIKGRPVESITSASPGAGTEEDQYPSIPPTPPLRPQPPAQPADLQAAGAKNKHRSNPSTASSGYLRAAEEIMANLRNRAVSESASASALESSLGTVERKPLSETDDNVHSSETDGYEYEDGQGGYEGEAQKEWTMQTNPSSGSGGRSFRSSPESNKGSRSHGTINLSGSLRRSVRSNRASLHGSISRAPQPQQYNAADLNRFVSSTTVPTSTTISTSFIKHAGPRGPNGRAANAGGRGMMMIRPDEVSPDALQGLSAQGGMRFDPVANRWIRNRLDRAELGRVSEGSESRLARSDESEDVFAGMSEGSPSRSARMSGGGTVRSQRSQGSGIGEGAVAKDGAPVAEDQESRAEEQELDSESEGDDGPADAANTTIINAHWSDHSGSTSGNTSVNSSVVLAGPLSTSPPQELVPPTPQPPRGPAINLAQSPARPVPHHANSAPAVMTPLPSHLAPKPVRSALRNTNALNGNGAETPGPKKTAVWAENLTPAPLSAALRSATRSVSFSDGKRIGQIDGLPLGGRRMSAGGLGMGKGKAGPIVGDSEQGETPFSGPASGGAKGGNLFDMSGQSLQNSARTKRIQGLLDEMEELSISQEAETPSKPSRIPDLARPSLAPTPAPPQRVRPNPFAPQAGNETGISGSKRTLRRSRSFRENQDEPAKAAGQTFFTDYSFAVAHDQLVKVITDVQPFEPYWDTLESVDLSGKGLESVARLKDFLPGLDELKVDDNAISYLTGIPTGVRTLFAAGNRLTALASVDHLRNLQFLDVSRNQLDSVAQLSCLKHLRELKADYNRISNLSGITNLDSLRKVSVRSNRIDMLDLACAKWGKLENLDIAENGLGEIRELECLAGVVHLNLDDNDLTSLSSVTPLRALRTLRVSRNDLSHLDLSHFPKIRTVYADDNRLVRLTRSGGERSRLEALSLRSQRVKMVALSAAEVKQLKRLYMSGNEVRPETIPPMDQLRYLEMAACRFSSWPDLRCMPLLEVLNLNYNFLETLGGLKGAKTLRKVMIVGNRLCETTPDAAKSLAGLRIEELDLRMNPSTLGYYLPLFIPPPIPVESHTNKLKAQSHPNKTGVLLGRPNGTMSASRMSQSFFHQPESENWQEMDREFRRNLPDTWYGRRLLYRGVTMRALEGLRVLDGVEVGEGERKKAEGLLSRAGQ